MFVSDEVVTFGLIMTLLEVDFGMHLENAQSSIDNKNKQIQFYVLSIREIECICIESNDNEWIIEYVVIF